MGRAIPNEGVDWACWEDFVNSWSIKSYLPKKEKRKKRTVNTITNILLHKHCPKWKLISI